MLQLTDSQLKNQTEQLRFLCEGKNETGHYPTWSSRTDFEYDYTAHVIGFLMHKFGDTIPVDATVSTEHLLIAGINSCDLEYLMGLNGFKRLLLPDNTVNAFQLAIEAVHYCSLDADENSINYKTPRPLYTLIAQYVDIDAINAREFHDELVTFLQKPLSEVLALLTTPQKPFRLDYNSYLQAASLNLILTAFKKGLSTVNITVPSDEELLPKAAELLKAGYCTNAVSPIRYNNTHTLPKTFIEGWQPYINLSNVHLSCIIGQVDTTTGDAFDIWESCCVVATVCSSGYYTMTFYSYFPDEEYLARIQDNYLKYVRNEEVKEPEPVELLPLDSEEVSKRRSVLLQLACGGDLEGDRYKFADTERASIWEASYSRRLIAYLWMSYGNLIPEDAKLTVAHSRAAGNCSRTLSESRALFGYLIDEDEQSVDARQLAYFFVVKHNEDYFRYVRPFCTLFAQAFPFDKMTGAEVHDFHLGMKNLVARDLSSVKEELKEVLNIIPIDNPELD